MSSLSDKTVKQLRDEGYAVIIWTPKELDDCPPVHMEDLSIARGWVVLDEYENIGEQR